MSNLISRAEEKQRIAENILRELDLVNRWNRFGTCNLVGAFAYGLIVAPDIDMEIFCPDPRIEHGFEILRACALHPNVTRARFWNAQGPPHYGLYWRVDYKYEGEEWKIDMWSMADSYKEPCGTYLTEPMKRVLTPETRETILSLKEKILADPEMECRSIQIYRAVLDFEVRTMEELKQWLPRHPLTEEVISWKPGDKDKKEDAPGT
jgi:hypothetical protein